MVVNFFIDYFWDKEIKKTDLLKDIVDLPNTWFTTRLRQVAARESLDMISSARKEGKDNKPIHKAKRMCISSTIGELIPSKKSNQFDAWLHLSCIGRNIILDLPVKYHKHFNKLMSSSGKRLNSYIITEKYIQFCFEKITEEKKTVGNLIGIDAGINELASTSTGNSYGLDIKDCVERIKRCKHGSNG